MKKPAIIMAVMRKLLHLAYGVFESVQPSDPHCLSRPSDRRLLLDFSDSISTMYV